MFKLLTPLFALPLLAVLLMPADANAQRHRRGYEPVCGNGGVISVGVGYDRPRVRGHRRGLPRRVWVPGRYEIRHERVWIPERYDRRWHGPEYRYQRLPCGGRQRVVVRTGHWDRVVIPGFWDNRARRTWVPGHYR